MAEPNQAFFCSIWLNEKAVSFFTLQKYKVSKSNAILTFYEILKLFRLIWCKKASRVPTFGYF